MSNNKIPLKELCIEGNWGKYGIPASAEKYDSSKTRYLRITDISDYGELLDNDKKSVTADDIEKYILQEGDIVFARTGASTGKTYFHENKYGKLAFAGFLIKYALDTNKINPKYIKFYTLSSEYKTWVNNLSVGSTRGNINAQTFADCPITVPARRQQDLLVNTLSLLTEKIELNQRINAELESMAKSLYDYWFVQFDFPDEKGKPYKSAGGKMVWDEELKREIPFGWEAGELGKYCQTFRGVTYKKEDVKSPSDKNTIPILRATNISNAVIDVNDMVYIPEELVSEDQMMEKFDVLITMSSGSKAHVGKNAFYYYDNKVSFGAFCSKLSANENIRFYVNIHMQSDGFKKYISNVGLGTNINNLTNRHITEYKLLIPPKEQLLQFETAVEGFYNKIGNNMKESQTLTELRNWLLPMLMNGQVRVTG